jgi:lysyl-tRNA synthetase class 2
MVDMRAAVVMSLRDTLARRGYTEVETPMLQATNGGATARPFSTHFNAFDIDVYLRIALELPLKRCVVGGIERVYEIGRVLRNEGADSTHSPEFAMLETYEAYADYNTMATLTQDLYQNAARAVFGSTTVQQFDGTEVDLGGDWSQLSLYELVSEAVGEAITPETSLEALREQAEKHDIPVNPAWVAGKIVEELFESLCEEKLDGPVFIRDFPIDTSPLTRQHRTRAGVAEKWDLYIGRVERGTAYSELVDPVIERERLVAQSLAAANGDPEAMQLDEDFLRALEYGMPPTGGMGLGIDRMMQVFTGRGIRETLLFPFVRPE